MSTPSDAQLIAGWGGRCASAAQLARFTFFGGAAMVTRAALIDTCRAIDQVFRKWGYRARPGCGTGSMNCRPKTGGGGLSIHGLAGAWDINPCENPYGPRLITDMPAGMIADLLAIRFNNGRQVLTWGGSWRGNKDAMHLQTAGLPSDVATGINWATVARPSGSTVVLAPQTTDTTTTTPPPRRNHEMIFVIRCAVAGSMDINQVFVFRTGDMTRWYCGVDDLERAKDWAVLSGGAYVERTDAADWESDKRLFTRVTSPWDPR